MQYDISNIAKNEFGIVSQPAVSALFFSAIAFVVLHSISRLSWLVGHTKVKGSICYIPHLFRFENQMSNEGQQFKKKIGPSPQIIQLGHTTLCYVVPMPMMEQEDLTSTPSISVSIFASY